MEHAWLDTVRTSKPSACPLRLTNQLLDSPCALNALGVGADPRHFTDIGIVKTGGRIVYADVFRT
jgi:hypothetical protein